MNVKGTCDFEKQNTERIRSMEYDAFSQYLFKLAKYDQVHVRYIYICS